MHLHDDKDVVSSMHHQLFSSSQNSGGISAFTSPQYKEVEFNAPLLTMTRSINDNNNGYIIEASLNTFEENSINIGTITNNCNLTKAASKTKYRITPIVKKHPPYQHHTNINEHLKIR